VPPLKVSPSETPEAAGRHLVDSHLPLVRAVARRYAGRGEDFDDLVQVGAVGLVRASDRFDPSRGVAFAAFVTPAIEGEIRRHLRDRTQSLRIPREVQRLSRNLRRRQSELAAVLGRFPTLEELATSLDAEMPEVERALAAEAANARVTVAPDDDEVDRSGASEPLADSDDRILLEEGLRVLGERERQIVFLRFQADMTERQIAGVVGISQAQVSRLLDAALRKLRIELAAPDAPLRPDTSVISPANRPVAPPPEVSSSLESGGKASVGGSADSKIAPVGSEHDSPSSARPEKSKPASTYSGRFLVRMPSELHERLARAAERDEVSLNRFVTDALATSVDEASDGKLAPDPDAGSEAGGRAPDAQAPSIGALRVALATNLIVVVIAGLVALILLVLALERGI
jgi:RNA polymerase sigma-B factor